MDNRQAPRWASPHRAAHVQAALFNVGIPHRELWTDTPGALRYADELWVCRTVRP